MRRVGVMLVVACVTTRTRTTKAALPDGQGLASLPQIGTEKALPAMSRGNNAGGDNRNREGHLGDDPTQTPPKVKCPFSRDPKGSASVRALTAPSPPRASAGAVHTRTHISPAW